MGAHTIVTRAHRGGPYTQLLRLPEQRDTVRQQTTPVILAVTPTKFQTVNLDSTRSEPQPRLALGRPEMFGAPRFEALRQVSQWATRSEPPARRAEPSRCSPTNQDLIEVYLHAGNFGQGDRHPLQPDPLNAWRDVLHDHPGAISLGTSLHLRPHVGAKSCDHCSANDAAHRRGYPKAPIHRFTAYLNTSP